MLATNIQLRPRSRRGHSTSMTRRSYCDVTEYSDFQTNTAKYCVEIFILVDEVLCDDAPNIRRSCGEVVISSRFYAGY